MSVELIDSMGTDISIVNAARVSMHKESEWDYQDGKQSNCVLKEKDIKLINYLSKHNHWTPFAHAFLSFRIKVPMFVAMQLDKHTVGLVTNSVSRRYVDEEPEFWFPKEWRGRADNVKQGSGNILDDEQPTMVISKVASYSAAAALHDYNDLLGAGVAPEMARMVLPMNTMTERIWSGSLAAFSRVCKLRLDPHSQKEIQELAGMVAALVEPLFPVSWKALLEN